MGSGYSWTNVKDTCDKKRLNIGRFLIIEKLQRFNGKDWLIDNDLFLDMNYSQQ